MKRQAPYGKIPRRLSAPNTGGAPATADGGSFVGQP